MPTKKRSPKKTVPNKPVEVQRDPVDAALQEVVLSYLEQDLVPKMKPEANKVIASWVGRCRAETKPTYNGIEVTLVQKLGFGREVSGRLTLTTDFYSREGDILLRAVKAGIKEGKNHTDAGHYVGRPVYNAMKIETDVSFSCGGRTATEALGQAEQIRVMAHALLALKTYLVDAIHFQAIGDAILKHIKAAKTATAAV